jgi:hypothetical protein
MLKYNFGHHSVCMHRSLPSNNRGSNGNKHDIAEIMGFEEDDGCAYNVKKGVGFGAWGGFVASVVFTGIMLVIPLLLGLPTGSFLYAFGFNILAGSSSDQVAIGLAALALLIIQGIIVGAIFGAITSKSKKLHTSSKRKGVGLGLIAGLITFLVIYVPFMLLIFPDWLSNTITTFPALKLGSFGVTNYGTLSTSALKNYYLEVTFGVGIIAYLAYGAIMGGTVTLCYSVLHFVIGRSAKYTTDARKDNTNLEAA